MKNTALNRNELIELFRPPFNEFVSILLSFMAGALTMRIERISAPETRKQSAMLTTVEAAELVGLRPDALQQSRYWQFIGQPPYRKIKNTV